MTLSLRKDAVASRYESITYADYTAWREYAFIGEVLKFKAKWSLRSTPRSCACPDLRRMIFAGPALVCAMPRGRRYGETQVFLDRAEEDRNAKVQLWKVVKP